MNNEALAQIEKQCKSCTACDLAQGRTNVVFGVGNPNADIMFIGEGPGQQEDRTGKPFVGRAGQLLDKFLFAVDLERDDVYIANIVKCRPPQNRDPQPGEVETCINYLRQQIKAIAPKIIVCLGRVAAMHMIDPHIKVTKEHGHWHIRDGIHVTATFHPAALLRNPNNKPDALDDFMKVTEKLAELQGQQN